MSKRRTHNPEFKARVAMEAITPGFRKDVTPFISTSGGLRT
jgi:transposase-like protein